MIHMTVPVGPTRRTFERLLLQLPVPIAEKLKQELESNTDPAAQEAVMSAASVKYPLSASLRSDKLSAEEFANIT